MNTITVPESFGRKLIRFSAWEQIPGLIHGFTTRRGGVSPEPYDWNFGRSSGDSPENVLANEELLSEMIGIPADHMVVSSQVHGVVIRRIGEEDAGKGVVRPRDFEGVDGLVTDTPGICLLTVHADCVPLYFYDPEHRAIGLSHAGWRGTVDGIGARTVETMQREFGSRPGKMLCGIGPSIGPEAFEVGEEVARQFAARYGESLEDDRENRIVFRKNIPGKYWVDLWEANARTLEQAGVSRGNITAAAICTYEHAELFHSYRRDKSPGRMAAFLALVP